MIMLYACDYDLGPGCSFSLLVQGQGGPHAALERSFSHCVQGHGEPHAALEPSFSQLKERGAT